MSQGSRDLPITNRKYLFENTSVTATGISDFYKLAAVRLQSKY